MNFDDFLLSNPEINNNIKAVIKNKVLLNKVTNIYEKEELNKRININIEIIKKHIDSMKLGEQTENELYENIEKMVDILSNDYNKNINFKQNYNNAINQLKNGIAVDDSIEYIDEEISDDSEEISDNSEEISDNSEEISDDSEEISDDSEEISDDSEEISDDKVKIVVNEHGYNIDGAKEPKDINLKLLNKKTRRQIEENLYGDDYDEIMENIKDRRVRKSYDPNLLKILYNRFDKDTAIKYLQELSKGRKAKKDNLPYEITYDIKSIKRSKQIKTTRQLRNMLKMARKNKHVAKVVDRKRKAAKIGAIALLATAAAGLANTGTTSKEAKETNRANNLQNTYIDTYTPITESQNSQTTHEEHNNNTTTLTEQNNNDSLINQNTQTEQNNSFQDSIKVETNTDLAQKQIDDLIEKFNDFNLGDKVELDEGINYTEDSLGNGNTGTVGKVQWRPSGSYIVNGVSIINPETNEIVTYSFGTNKDGTKNEEFSLVEYLKENVKKGMEVKFHIDKDGTKPTGWIDSSNIIESIDKEQETQENTIDLDISY